MPTREAELVSVIVPCFNQAKFLPDAVRSLQAQTHQLWECVIINDGSTDDTATVGATLAYADARIRHINQGNRGLAGARNRGLAEARGRFIQFLDADDLIESDKFKVQTAQFAGNPEIDIVYSDARYFPSDDLNKRLFSFWGEDYPWISSMAESPEPTLTKLVSRNIMPVSCPLVRRSIIEQVGWFDEHLPALEDWDYWIRCASNGAVFRFVAAPDSLALIRCHKTSMSRDSSRMSKAHLEIRIKIGRIVQDPTLRLLNFKLGANTLFGSNSSNWRAPLFRLARANGSVRVYARAFIQMIDKQQRFRGWTRRLLRLEE